MMTRFRRALRSCTLRGRALESAVRGALLILLISTTGGGPVSSKPRPGGGPQSGTGGTGGALGLGAGKLISSVDYGK